eukprot:2085609-Rhodomonas_salina.1
MSSPSSYFTSAGRGTTCCSVARHLVTQALVLPLGKISVLACRDGLCGAFQLAVLVGTATRRKTWLRVRGLEQDRLCLAFWEEVPDNSDVCLGTGIECEFHAFGVRVVIGRATIRQDKPGQDCRAQLKLPECLRMVLPLLRTRTVNAEWLEWVGAPVAAADNSALTQVVLPHADGHQTLLRRSENFAFVVVPMPSCSFLTPSSAADSPVSPEVQIDQVGGVAARLLDAARRRDIT